MLRRPGRERLKGYEFTGEFRRVLSLARDEALRFQHDYIGTEHLLLGLIANGAWPAWVRELGAEPDAVVLLVEQSVRKGNVHPLPKGELPYTSRAKKALVLAMEEARLLQNPTIDPSNLLTGLVFEQKGIAAQVLDSFGVTPDVVRRHMKESYVSPELRRMEELEPSRRKGPRFTFAIDDSSPSSIYEQIIAQVREAVATGALGPSERLPTVRRLADELDIAPGTVARAYAELEQLGVVQTEGARGTRVAERAPRGQPAGERRDTLIGLLRPVAVAAFHLGATATELRAALERAMDGVLREDERT